jgi:alkylation response protein AidB-like acyl-CoA dehydrogenase
MAVLTEEQSMLRDAARAWAAEQSPVSTFRKLRDGGSNIGHDPAAFALIAEMGWAGVVIPAAYGGSDFGYFSLGLVLEEIGRTLTASPLLSSALAATAALILGGSENQKAAWLPRIAEGKAIATLAFEEGGRHSPARMALTAQREGEGWRLDGTKNFVLDGMAADLFVVAARSSGLRGEATGITLFLVSAGMPGLSRRPLKLIDARGEANLQFDNLHVGTSDVLGTVDGGFGLLSDTLDRACIGQAAEMLGAALQAFDVTLDYLKTRVQFGQLIGSFQALQHRAAEMFVELELTRSSVEAALRAIDEGAANLPELASIAKIRACDTLHLISNEMIQLHGGIGMTDEHDAGLYLKRSRVMEAAYGNAAWHRERFARLNGM